MTARRASFMLVVVTALWGVSFTWTHSWQEAGEDADKLLSAVTLIGLRMTLGAVLLGLWQPWLVLAPTRKEHLGGAALAAVFFIGFVLQTWGLAYTTPALSGFFTSLCSAWAPLIALFLWRERVSPWTHLGLLVALAGCAVLVEGWNLGFGDWLTVGASALFAVQMLVLDRLGKSMAPAHLSASFLATTGALGVACAAGLAMGGPGLEAWWGWVYGMLSRRDILVNFLCQTIFPTVLAFHWMNSCQPVVPVTRAALIYLLEPIFSSLFSLAWGPDELSLRLVLGGTLILAGNLFVELPRLVPLWRRARYDAPSG
ncbi:MAG: DMT family transporter [Gemmataceae bacterium]